MAPLLSYEHIETAISALSVQHRTMIRLLLLQYLDLTDDEIRYMAEDQPDCRFLAGNQPAQKASIEEAAREITARVAQYRGFLRQKRERPWLQIQCLKQQLALSDRIVAAAEHLLSSTFEVDTETLAERRRTALSAVPKPEIRRLEKAWSQDEITEKDYQKARLLIEYQTIVRRRERQRRRLLNAEREFASSGISPLQDHEIAHIWGIPLSSLAARKVKALHLYLSNLQAILERENRMPDSSQGRPDLWKETFAVLTQKPVERSIVSFIGGIERTEEALLEKLTAFAQGTLPEEAESAFWTAITKIHDSEHSGPWLNHARAIFALQRLSAILSEIDPSPEELEQDLLARVTPKPKTEMLSSPAISGEGHEPSPELSEAALGVLQAFTGEIDDKRTR